jgi:hypothetical protein
MNVLLSSTSLPVIDVVSPGLSTVNVVTLTPSSLNVIGMPGEPGPQGPPGPDVLDGAEKITVGNTAPVNPAVNDVWIDTT